MLDLTGNLDDFLKIVLFVTPGFLTWTFFCSLMPSKKRSDLEITILSVVISAVLSFFSLKLFFILDVLGNITYCSPFTERGTSSILVVSIILGLILAWVISKFLKNETFLKKATELLRMEYRPFSRVWDSFFSTLVRGDVVKIVMATPPNYIGVVKAYSADPNDEVQEIELWKPLYYGGIYEVPTPVVETERVLINSRVILSIERIYPEKVNQLYPSVETDNRNGSNFQ